MLDLLLVLTCIVGFVVGLLAAARQALALLLVSFIALIVAVVGAMLASLAVTNVMGGPEYYTRLFSFVGLYLLVLLLGTRSAWNEIGTMEQSKLPVFVDRILGALLGVLCGPLFALFLFLVSLQVPALTPHISHYFWLATPAAQNVTQKAVSSSAVAALEAGASSALGQSTTTPSAPALVRLVAGVPAGDYYAAYIDARKDEKPDPFLLCVNLGKLVNAYSKIPANRNSPWLKQATNVIRKTFLEDEAKSLEQVRKFFQETPESDRAEIEGMLVALGTVNSDAFREIQYNGEQYLKSLDQAEKLRESGKPLKAAMAAVNSRRFLAKITGRMLPPRQRPPGTTPGTGQEQPRPVQRRFTIEDVKNDLKNYRFVQARGKARLAMMSAAPEEKSKYSNLANQAVALAEMHQALLRGLRRQRNKFTVIEEEGHPHGTVFGATPMRVTIMSGGAAKGYAWNELSPRQLLNLYEQVVPGEKEGIEAFRSLFGL